MSDENRRLVDAEWLKHRIIHVFTTNEDRAEVPSCGQMLHIIDTAPESKYISEEPCDFCSKFDFSRWSATVDKHGWATIQSSVFGSYPEEATFNYCPVCGRKLK